jgi:hypothetical protein
MQAAMLPLLPYGILLRRESEFLSWQLNPSDFDQVMLLPLCPHRGAGLHSFLPPMRLV